MKVRAVDLDGVQVRVASDLATAIGFTRPKVAIKEYCQEKRRFITFQDRFDRTQRARILSPPDVQRLEEAMQRRKAPCKQTQ